MSKILGIICDISNSSPVGVIASNISDKEIVFITKNKSLDIVIETLLEDNIFLQKREELNGSNMILNEKIDINDEYFFISLNYSLPIPYRIMGIKEFDGDVEKIVFETFNYLVKEDLYEK